MMADLEQVLSGMDAADRVDSEMDDLRAQTDLERILDRGSDVPRVAKDVAGGRSGSRHRAVAVGALIAATAALLLVPSPFDGDRAYATWVASPTGLSATQGAAAAASCRDVLLDGAAAEEYPQVDGAKAVLAERRGVWTTVVLTGVDDVSALCVSDDSAGWFTSGFIGSVGVFDGASPGPDGLVATDLGSGSIDGTALSLASGLAGDDVIAVAYRSRSHGVVDATVTDGHFALWFPGTELTDTSRGVAVEVTYKDGTHGRASLRLDQ